MLKVWVGDTINDKEEYINAPEIFFDYSHAPEWILSDFSKLVIKKIDKSEVIDKDCIMSPILGAIPVSEISGGTKTLIMMNFDDSHIFNASSCGDNCADFIVDISERKDLTIRLGYIMEFPSNIDLNGVIMNTGKEFHTQNEFIDAYLEV
jgi:hypothetical protein